MTLITEAPVPYELGRSRRCSRCGEVKPIDEFPMKVRARGLRRVWCRDCCRAYGREHYRKNKDVYLANNARRRQNDRPRVKASIDAYLREHPCVDCGCADITLLEFDHRDPLEKDRDVAELARDAQWPRVMREIAKCDVRCANCHRRRTAVQFKWAKEHGIVVDPSVIRPGHAGRYAALLAPLQLALFSDEAHGLRRCSRCGELKPLAEFAFRDLRKGLPSSYCRACKADHRRCHYLANRADYMGRAVIEAKLKRQDTLVRVLEYLRCHPCVDCGETDLRVLEFDHRDGVRKTMAVMSMIGRRNWRTIWEEIQKCDVRCANCHRRRTAIQQAWKYRLAESEGRYVRMRSRGCSVVVTRNIPNVQSPVRFRSPAQQRRRAERAAFVFRGESAPSPHMHCGHR